MNINHFYDLFPPLPLYKATWTAIQLEPIVGSGERITIAVCAIGENNEFRITQSLSDEILEMLFRNKKKHINDLIYIISKSLNNHLSKGIGLNEWKPPFMGVILGNINTAMDVDIDGVINQGLRFSSSLSNLLDNTNNDRGLESDSKKKYIAKFSSAIQEQVTSLYPNLASSFNQRIHLVDKDAKTSFGFLNDKYVSNFGLITPSNLSGSLTNIKARIFDIEALKKSSLLIKPETYEVIVGSPSFNDPTLSSKVIYRLKNSFEMIEEIADKEDIRVFKVHNANEAGQRIINLAA
ncbi:hypothetical protein [Photobacterium damselae]|uniref:hypothetical protein n=1 Tax=Photobacterium damselae TaxID=38293 RepID=UPI00370C5320